MTNRERFLTTYTEKLANARKRAPDEYPWPESELPLVAERMTAAYARGSAAWGSAGRATCRALGIKANYQAVRQYLAENGEGQS